VSLLIRRPWPKAEEGGNVSDEIVLMILMIL
jgi:hypothetical protein